MKAVTILALLLFASSAYGELTREDIRTIVKEENAALEKRVKEYIDLKIDALDQKVDALNKSLNGRIDDIRSIMIALIALVTAAIAVPQIIMAYKERGQKDMQTQQQAMQS